MKKKNKKNEKKKLKRRRIVSIVISVIFTILLLFFIAYLFYVKMIPNKYLIIATIILLLIQGILDFFLIKGKMPIKILVILFLLINFTGYGVIVYYFNGLNNTLSDITEFTETENYSVIVRNDEKIKELKDLEYKKIGIINTSSKNYAIALKELDKKIDTQKKVYESMNLMIQELVKEEIDGFLINSNNLLILEENIVNFSKTTKTLEEIPVEIIKKKEAEYKHKYGPFNILISGIDTDGNINKTSRSDVNMILTVNPKSHDILITNVVRDMYVQLHETTGLKDKLTHAGMYGIDSSRQTLEDFLETEIPYYVRVNFDSVVKIIDAIGGIDIYNEYGFKAYNGQYFRKGYIHLRGKDALIYARERKHLSSGDWSRGEHQQVIINAVINKITSSTEILNNYSTLMNTIGKYVQTNIPEDTIKKYIRDQLESMPSWNINKTSVGVSDGYRERTYSMPDMKLYVSIPDEKSRQEHVKKINDLLAKEK